MDSVAVVVINYKGIDDTLECLDSLFAQSYADLMVIVVENGSGDGSAQKLNEYSDKHADSMVILCNDENLGFTGGANTGIRWALENNYDYVALLNNDAVADRDWAKNLHAAAKKHKSGMTTGLLLLADGKRIDSTGDWFSKWGLGFPRNRGDVASEAPDGGFVFGASGGATLFSTKMLRQIGIFDDDFFAYYEDSDISFRAQLAGWKVYYQPSAVAYHKLMQTSGKMRSGFATYHTFKNLPLVYVKNVPLSMLLSVGVRFYLAYWLMVGRAITRGEAGPALHGVVMSLLLGIKKLPTRWRIQHRRKVPTSYIRSILWDDLPPEQTGLRKLRKLFTGKS